jgi:excinuclease ABC subunit A
VRGGRCEACQGDGLIKVEMHFLPDVYVPCDVCHGKRYNRETLEIRYKGHSIHDVLEMTVEDALELFEPVPDRAQAGNADGRGPELHQAGPERDHAVRRRGAAREAVEGTVARDTGRTLYILDEPTTGLHFHDIEHLLAVLHKLRDDGNTVVVIEHNLDVIKTADWVVDLGPEGRPSRRPILATGTPERPGRVQPRQQRALPAGAGAHRVVRDPGRAVDDGRSGAGRRTTGRSPPGFSTARTVRRDAQFRHRAHAIDAIDHPGLVQFDAGVGRAAR